MADLDQVAYSLGLDWAEETFRSLHARGIAIPDRWPGTIDEARALVSAFVGDTLDVGDREWLVYKTQTRAESLWPEFFEEA
jgi:hypothetical protein